MFIYPKNVRPQRRRQTRSLVLRGPIEEELEVLKRLTGVLRLV
jgi:hypothetical protein